MQLLCEALQLLCGMISQPRYHSILRSLLYSRCAPVGILCLISANILEIDDLSDTFEMLAMYVVTVLCGLFIHSAITLPVLFFLVTRRSPIKFVKGMMQALVTSFGTASRQVFYILRPIFIIFNLLKHIVCCR